MASVCETITNIVEPTESESEICESALQPQNNFVELDNYGLDSPKGSIHSKSSDEEEEKKKEAKVKVFSVAKKEESKQSIKKVK